jgi:Fe-S-cluster containining protein
MSTLLNCPLGHQWWEPFTDGPARGTGTSACPRCDAEVELPFRPPAATRLSLPLLPPPAFTGKTGTLTVELDISFTHLLLQLIVPAEPARMIELLSVIRRLAETIVGLSVRAVEARGEKVSCKAGCGACCRQLVPISGVEARHLRNMVDQLPEPRRTEVRTRFAEARRRLEAFGVLDKLLHPERCEPKALVAFGVDYFHLGIPCPFLDGESCSIYAERPIACRQYLVTSPAENCAHPTAETVRCVPLGADPSVALNHSDADLMDRSIPLVPLIVALEWAERYPEEPPPRSGPELMEAFFTRLLEQGQRRPNSTANETTLRQ